MQYAIRESTLYFLSDLVCEYFLKSENETSCSKIQNSSWYFSEYNLDASIKSMMAAVVTIEDLFNKAIDIDFKQFGNFILNRLQMLYYDMGNRTQGEETFVIINTTGEPLSATENLKPIIIGNIDNEEERKKASDEWEEREEWFWQNKIKEETTSDDGINQFFIWYWQIRLLQERSWKNNTAYPLNPRELFTKKPKTSEENEENPEVEKWEESIKTITIQRYFKAFQQLIELSKDEKIVKVLKTIKNELISVSWFRNADLYVVLPLIVYLEKFPESKLFYEFTRRIRKNYFDEKRKRGNTVDWRHIIQLIDFSKNEEDVLIFKTKSNETIQFKNISNVELKEWFTQDEQFKNELKLRYKSEIEYWEDHIDLMGNLAPLWKANQERENTYENIKCIYDNFELLNNCYDENKSKDNPILSNYIRLYRVLTEPERLTKPYNTSGMQGAWFSRKNIEDNSYFGYLKDEYYLSLFKINEKVQLLENLKLKIKELFPKNQTEITDENFNAIKHLKIWLLFKVLKVEESETLLFFWDGKGTERNDGNGLASYDERDKNKLIKNLPFSMGNSICGFAVKRLSYLTYATDLWEEQRCLDNPLGDSITREEFENRENTPIISEKIEKIDNELQKMLNNFYN